MKKLIPFLMIAVILTGCAVSREAGNAENGYRQITAAEAVSLMETEENYIILDVRTQAEYEEKHIPGAICIPNETIGSDHLDSTIETCAGDPTLQNGNDRLGPCNNTDILANCQRKESGRLKCMANCPKWRPIL